MGAVDLVIQVEAPPSVASGLQRVGRAGHQVGAVSRGVLFPKFRGDLIDTAVVVQRMRDGLIESLHIPANPLDVLAQQIVSIVALDTIDVDELYAAGTPCAPFATLPRSAYDGVLDMLSGRYPSDEFAELRPRIVFDRVSGEISGRPGAQRLAVTSGGTIPDRGLFGVFLVGESTNHRVGELDEEMVYESRVGDVFTLGASSWRIEDITHDRVLVSPAPGQPGRLPFWKGDAVGRPAELGAATGAFVRTMAALPAAKAVKRARDAGLDEYAANNLVSYLAEQREATSRVPDDITIVVERFRDELGDWRVCIHSPYGGQVHGPWALAIAARLRERYGMDAQSVSGDDGIVLRLPETDEPPPGADLVLFDPAEIEDLITAEVGGSALFASRFRECAARALLLPRRNPGRRSPLWQQRQRSAQLLSVASKYGSFPIVLETLREVPAGRLRHRRAEGSADRDQRAPGLRGRGRDPRGLALREVAAVRLCRRLHVRGRHPAGREARGRAGPGPVPAGRAARPDRAARAARRRGGPADRGRAATPGRGPARPRPRRASSTCYGWSGRCRSARLHSAVSTAPTPRPG